MLLRLIFLSFFSIAFAQKNKEARVLNDSALAIYKSEPNQALFFVKEADSISNLQKDKQENARSKYLLGLIYRDLGEYEKAIEFSEKAIKKTKDSLILANSYNNIGGAQRQLALYEDALKNYLKATDIFEAKKATRQLATVTNNIGLVYSYLGVKKKAVKYHLEAKTIFENLGYKKGISEAYNNVAIIYANDGDLDKALNYFKYSLEVERELGDKRGIAESVNNVGAVFYYLEEIDSALYYFKSSAQLEKEIRNYAGVGASYNNIAQVLLENNRVNSSKRFIDSAYYYAKKYNVSTDIETAYFNYSQYYEAKNENDNALEYFKKFSAYKDSIVNVKSTSKIAALEIEHKTERKERQILEQRAILAEKELDISEKKNYILGLSVLALVLGLIGYLLYNQQRIKNRQLQKENELKDALQKIETQNRLQDQRLRISRDLHDNIGAQLTFIISSIDNLKYGLKLPDKLQVKLSNISEFTTNTISELRDTIWAMNKNEISFEDLKIRILNFINKADLATQNISFNFKVDEAIDANKTFTSVQGMNIYRIIQEAINNAVKYAQPTEVEVLTSIKDNKFYISVSDNGKGFNLETVDLGNGLNNIKKRANEINADFEIQSEIGKGTSVTLNV